MGIDVWEHAYYKKYGPGRVTISSWWNVVDWSIVSENCKLHYEATQNI